MFLAHVINKGQLIEANFLTTSKSLYEYVIDWSKRRPSREFNIYVYDYSRPKRDDNTKPDQIYY
jgi:hypothetical protein